MTPEETVITEEQPPTDKHLCHVHNECNDDTRQSIHKDVCRDLATIKHTDDKHYCLLHLPAKEKDTVKFQQIINTRFDKFAGGIAKAELDYDFRYVWFPKQISFSKLFTGNADFSSATFSGNADFSSAAFSGNANFNSANFNASANFSSAKFSGFADFRSSTFSSSAYFNSANFIGYANFISVTFTDYAYFSSTIFTGEAYFSSTTFINEAYFGSATFTDYAYFSLAIFAEKSQTYFIDARFCSSVWFSKTVVEGYVEFEGNIFLEADKVQEVKKELEAKFAKLQKELAERAIKFNVPVDFIKDGQEAVFEFQDVRLRNPERVSFSSMQLRPSRFVNVDEARKVAFNEVEWLNTEIDVDRIGLDLELKSLEDRKLKGAEKLLIKACNQLADNAEASRRFEEAKQFRKQGIALQKRPCHIHDAVQSDKKADIREKVCGNFPVANEDGGQYYCLWHNPDKNKAEVFLKEFKKRQDDKHTDFRAVVFPITVKYNGEVPTDLDFTGATFQRACVFHEATIHNLTFTEAYFEEDAKLEFKESTCDGKINLDEAVFKGRLFFYGAGHRSFFKEKEDTIITDQGLSLKNARFDKPQNANFRNICLRLHYFIEVDVSKFSFHNCGWVSGNKGKQLPLKGEIKLASKPLISQTCNQLAINYEEIRDYREASYFRFCAIEAKRLEYTEYSYLSRIYTLFWLYKVVSGYGEKWHRALGVLLALLLGFSALFWSPISTFDYGEQKTAKANDEVEQLIYQTATYSERFRSMETQDAIFHSLSVATFQRPEPKAYGFWTKLFVVLETIFAPLLVALLALAIRRKFMR
jgi:uncharacterized protein YjbI with pentapeptide repeats